MQRLKMSPEEFFDGLLLALAFQGKGTISGEPTEIHRAFYRVLKALQGSNVLDVDLFDVDYDPLYSQSGWFDRALTTAQRDAIIGFANPSYRNITIKYTQGESEVMLKAIEGRDELERLAGVFSASLQAAAPKGPSL